MVGRATPEKGTSLLVWSLTGQIHKPMISAFSENKDDGALLTTIALSGDLAVSRGPNK